MSRLVRALTWAVAIALSLAAAGPAGAAAPAPSVTLDRASVNLADTILVSLHDWPIYDAVTVSVCGNGARRGSVDCNLTNSQGLGINRFDAQHVTQFAVHAPPFPCPCVVRVSNATQSLLAVTPIAIANFPTAPIVGDAYRSPLAITLRVRHAPQGFAATVRSRLGGPTSYVVRVTLRNRSTDVLDAITIRARAGRRSGDQARLVDIRGPGQLAPGATWSAERRVTLAAPVLGRFRWTVTASGAGPAATGRATTDHVPVLLYLIVLALIADVAWIVVRRMKRPKRTIPRTRGELAIVPAR
ncbi:MAG: hypothetical protein H0U92_14575 [Actinobacteria bacterium]|nr:hypothetical protein [Actinomycetota bacterium]